MRNILSFTLQEQPTKPSLCALPEGYHFAPLDSKEKRLAKLLYDSFKDSLDDQGESLEEWETEVASTISGKYGEILPSLSFNLFHDETLIGTLITSLFRGIPLILYVAIHPTQQGNGLAKQLIQQAKEELKKSKQHQELFLVVAAKNIPAYRLYKTIGFVERGTNWDDIL